MNNLELSLALYKPIQSYNPRVGDFVIWHGWFTHYYGIVNYTHNNKVKIIKAGLPELLFNMDQSDMEKNSIIVDANKIKKSKDYAILQSNIWYT